MSVSSSTAKTGPLACNGSLTAFPSGAFRILAADEITVLLTDSDGVETTLTLTTNYTIAPTGGSYPADSYTINTVATYDAGNSITMIRNNSFTQGTSYGKQGPFDPQIHETDFDRCVLRDQELKEELDRCIKNTASATDPVTDPQEYLQSCQAAQAGAETAETNAGASELAAEAAADAVANNVTTQYRGIFAAGAGEITESSNIMTDVNGKLILTTAAAAHTPVLRLSNTNPSGYSADLEWYTGYGSGYVTGGIKSEASGSYGGNVIFKTADISKVLQTAMTILNNQAVMIGTISQYGSEKLGVEGDIAIPVINEYYLGPDDTDGSCRLAVVGGIPVLQKRIASTWTTQASSEVMPHDAGLVVATTGVATASVSATSYTMYAADGSALIDSSISEAVAITSSGAGGLDTGSEAADTWYYIWMISNGSNTAAMLSLQTASPTMPSGYTYKRLVGAVRNDSGSDFITFRQVDSDVKFSEEIIVQASGLTTGAWTSKDISSFFPSSICKDMELSLATDTAWGLSHRSDGHGGEYVSRASPGPSTTFGGVFATAKVNRESLRVQSTGGSSIYYFTTVGAGPLNAMGYTIANQ